MSLLSDHDPTSPFGVSGDHRLGAPARLAVVACVAALAAAALASMAALSGARSVAPSWFDYMLFALSGACLLVGLVALLWRHRARASSLSGRDAFEALFDGAAGSAVLSDAAGRVVAANDAAASGGEGGSIAGLLAAQGANDGLVYRLAHRALAEGEARETGVVVDGEPSVLAAKRLSGDRLLWSVTRSATPSPAAHTEANFAHIRMSASGALLAANHAFDAMSAEDRQKLIDAASTALEGGASFGEVSLSTGAATIAISRHPDPADVFLLPPSSTNAPNEAFFEHLPVAIARLSVKGEVLSINEAARALLGDAAKPGCDFRTLVEGLGRPIDARIAEALEGRGGGRADLTRGARADREVYLRVALSRVEADGEHALLAVINDATELRTLEEQFVQSQKMQAVGQLAGGVAHDFNNLLTAILGHCDLMAMRRDDSDPDFEDLSQIRQNANRAAALVRQLLAFSRQQKLNPKACALQDTLGELSHLLNRLIGEKVSLEVGFDNGLWPVWIDERQFEQVILNLVVNARDAMPGGGQIRISCRNETLDEELKRDRAVVPEGDYVLIEVSDEGCGMSDETKAKVFEPFFTTKGPGEGTGLGLSTAYGIVKQTGGFIFIDSVPGEGAVFRILFPRLMNAPITTVVEEDDSLKDLTGAGRILLVEDEAPVRTFARRALSLRGYDVIEAENAEVALAILDDADEGGEEIDLVVSDVMMPGLDGPTWVREARKKRPDLCVIFTSGYAEDVFRKGLTDLGNCGFLPKPFTLEDLGAAVKTKLNEKRALVDAD